MQRLYLLNQVLHMATNLLSKINACLKLFHSRTVHFDIINVLSPTDAQVFKNKY